MADKKDTKKVTPEAILAKIKSEKINKHQAVSALLKPDLKKKK